MQHECIPQAVLGMDIVCQAKSGMGKTAVFVIATLQQLEPVDGTVRIKNIKKEFFNYIHNNVIVTYIKAKDLDEAFVLFDSQNTRGRSLDRKDLLKVHHIRFIQNYNKQK